MKQQRERAKSIWALQDFCESWPTQAEGQHLPLSHVGNIDGSALSYKQVLQERPALSWDLGHHNRFQRLSGIDAQNATIFIQIVRKIDHLFLCYKQPTRFELHVCRKTLGGNHDLERRAHHLCQCSPTTYSTPLGEQNRGPASVLSTNKSPEPF